jgi:hypothetical protein
MFYFLDLIANAAVACRGYDRIFTLQTTNLV